MGNGQASTTAGRRVVMTLTTPLEGDDGKALVLAGFRGHEGISECFNFQLDIVVKKRNNKEQPLFEKLLGQTVAIRLERDGGVSRYFNGICISIGQGEEHQDYTLYGVEIAPRFALLNKQTNSRIFQHKNVPDILRDVLTRGRLLVEGKHWEFDLEGEGEAAFKPRNYCVQYRESDFNFASRLMEEEGIYYYFTHDAEVHKMILSNKPTSSHSISDPAKVKYQWIEGGVQPEDRIHCWNKIQRLTAVHYVLHDSHFELPGSDLEAWKWAPDIIKDGQVSHRLWIKEINNTLEVYDYPGEYAQRFDSVPKEGSGKQDDMGEVIWGGDKGDADRTAKIRMEQEASQALFIRGASFCLHFMSGHRFTLEVRKPPTPAQVEGTATSDKVGYEPYGEYLLTSVQHAARGPVGRSGDVRPSYHNLFTCIPVDVKLPYRPLQRTLKPVVYGTQTAVVVGPKGQEIHTDKYGRVKVQFPWFRKDESDQKKYARDSSCWVRVAQAWAGARWGTSFWPRIGQEVVVAFLEGDPDRPIIVGSVYNDSQLPPYLGDPPDFPSPDKKHPRDPKVSGIKTNTTPGGVGFNELRFDDTKGKEQVFIHSQRNMDVRVRASSMERVGGSRHLIVGGKDQDGNLSGDQIEEVYRDKELHVHRHQNEHIDGSITLRVGGGEGDNGIRAVKIDKSSYELIGEDMHLKVAGKRQECVTNEYLVEAKEFHLKAGTTVVIDAGADLTIKGPGGFVKIDAAGVTIQGNLVKVNCPGGTPGAIKVANPQEPGIPPVQTPAEADRAKTGFKSAPSDGDDG